MGEASMIGGCRTAFGRFGGGLGDVKRGEPARDHRGDGEASGHSQGRKGAVDEVEEVVFGRVVPRADENCPVALVPVSGESLQELGVKHLARALSYARAGVDPAIMGVDPVYAVPKAPEKAGLQPADSAAIELNGAVAAQAMDGPGPTSRLGRASAGLSRLGGRRFS